MIREKIVIAHRGASAYVRENTMESYTLAIEQGADMIEFDVRKTKDNIFISYHNSCIQAHPVQMLTYQEILFLSQKDGFKIPCLKEILKLAKGKIKLDIELKEKGYEKIVIDLVKNHLPEDEFIITSFNDSSLSTIKDIFSGVKVGLILGKKNPEKFLHTRFSEIFPWKRFNHTRADFCLIHWKLARFGTIKRAIKHNIPVLVWTINEKKQALKFLKDRRITGIITDKPDLVLALKSKTYSFSRAG